MDDFWKDHFVVDVETDGPCPGLYNMISFGIASVYDPSLSFYSGYLKPDVMHPGITEARSVCGVSFQDQVWTGKDLADTMFRAREWLFQTSYFNLDNVSAQHGDFVMWSDNPAFDYQFMNYYFVKYHAGRNLFGHSAHRIGDVYWGMVGRKEKHTWKEFREVPHDHNPENDARGNAIAMYTILEGGGGAEHL